jgi:hypothetical protein
MRHVVQLDAERGRDLRDGSGQNDRPSRRMLLNHGQSLRLGKGSDSCEVGGVRSVVPGKILPAQMGDAFAGSETRQPSLQRRLTAASDEDAHLETLRGIRRSHHARARHGRPFASLQENFRHLESPEVVSILVYVDVK